MKVVVAFFMRVQHFTISIKFADRINAIETEINLGKFKNTTDLRFIMNFELIKKTAIEVLENIPVRPFLCLSMSAVFYAMLKNNHSIEAKLITGHLTYNNQYIFKQDFSINNAESEKLREWSGHAWVCIEDFICDLSFFRTLYSEKFIKPYKSDLITLFGAGRGVLIVRPTDLQPQGLRYHAIDTLDDDLATGIIKSLEYFI